MVAKPGELERRHGQAISGLAQSESILGSALIRHRNFRGSPMSFRGRSALVELYRSAARGDGFDCVKGVQLGLTELQIQVCFEESGWRGRIVAYVLPTDRVRDRFVTTRINRYLRTIPAYRSRLPGAEREDLRSGETGNLRAKQFGAGLQLYLGAATEGDFIEFSADTLIVDEYDSCLRKSSENLEKALERVVESPSPRLFRFGNPLIPRGGIERIYDEGDRRAYHWKCQRCGERQPINWLESVVEKDDAGIYQLRDRRAAADPTLEPRPVCRKCREPFDRDETLAAWIPLQPSEARKSYRIPRWDLGYKSIRGIFALWRLAQSSSLKLRAWWRSVGAQAWESGQGALTREELMAAAVLEPNNPSANGATAGIDVGSLFHVCVTDLVRGAGGRVERQGVWVGTVQTETQVLELLERHGVTTAVIDAEPEARTVARIKVAAESFGCTVWSCRFIPGIARATDEEFAARLNWDALEAQVDRTQLLDASADGIRLGADIGRAILALPPEGGTDDDLPDPGHDYARLFPCDVDTALGFLEQMQAPRRVYDDKGMPKWDEAGKADHFRLADAYDLLAAILNRYGGSYG